jgi:ornithine decarboxylase
VSEREPKTIPNIDYLGRSYDVVTMDPLNLGATSKNQNVIDIDVEEGHTVHTRDGAYIVPAGVRHEAPFSMSYETASTVMSSSYEFQREKKIAVSAEARVSGLDDGPTDEPPSFILDPEKLRASLREFHDAFPGIEVYYALKANSEPVVLTTFGSEGCGFEAASWGEIQLLRSLGIGPDRIIFGTSVKPRAHVKRAYHEGITKYAADSPEELSMLSEAAPRSKVFIRVKIDDSRSVFQMNGKFGSLVDEAANLLIEAERLGLKPWGLSFNVGSQAGGADEWAKGIDAVAPVIRDLHSIGIRLDILNIGGGFPTQYDGQNHIPLTEIASHVERALGQLPYVPRLIVEPGRRLVAASMSLVSNVVSRIARPDGIWLFLDCGVYNALFEALACQGRIEYPVRRLREHSEHSCAPFTLAGPTCDGLDIIKRAALLPNDTRPGDKLLFENVGAYTTVLSSSFNGFPRPTMTIRSAE